MKTIKTQLFALAITSMAIIGPLWAGATENEEKKDGLHSLDYSDYLNTYLLEKNIEEMMTEEGRVKIMNTREEMVMEGNISDEAIKQHMSISDLVTEVDGVKYFRLSYQ